MPKVHPSLEDVVEVVMYQIERCIDFCMVPQENIKKKERKTNNDPGVANS